MNDNDQSHVEAVLAKYRPAEAPPELLDHVERMTLGCRPVRRLRLAAVMSIAAEMLLGVIARGLITATSLIALLLLAAGGY